MKLTKRKVIAAMAAVTMSATALTSAMSAAALEGEGQSYTGNADYIGTYLTTDYFDNSAFQVSFRYESFDPNGTYVDEETGVVKTIDYNDTFQFLVFDSAYEGWDKTIAGPNGVNLTTPLTSDDLNTTTTYTVTVPIATIEEMLSTGNSPYGINLQLGGVGDTTVYVDTISYVTGPVVPGGEVTLTGSWVKGTGGKMTVEEGSAYVATSVDNINVYNFSTRGFVNPTVDVTVTYDTAPNAYVQSEIQTKDGTQVAPYEPYVDVTGTYTYTTEIPTNLTSILAVYDACTVTRIQIYDNHEGNALSVSEQSANDIIANIQAGYALGNAFELVNAQGEVDETAAGNPPVTEKLFQTIKAQGFKSVRIPITFLNMVNEQGVINTDYLDRIQAVVDRALDVGFYVSISIHNDGGEGVPGKWLDISYQNGSSEFNAVVTKFSNMWSQIAGKFANYNQSLIFEGMNEVMITGLYNRDQFTDEEFYNAYANITELNQKFVDAVRGTGNDANDDRVLVVPGYNTDIDMTVAGFDEGVFYMPADTATDRLALRIGYFTPSNFTLGGSYGDTNTWNINGQYGISYMVSQLTKVSGYGVPIFVGEYAAAFKNNMNYVENYIASLNFAAKSVTAASGTSFATEYWDNGVVGVDSTGTGLIDRRFNIVTPTGTAIIDKILNPTPDYSLIPPNSPNPPEPNKPDISLIENGGPYTGDDVLIGTYYKSLYSLRNKLQIKFKYNVLYSTRVDENGKEVDVDFNDTFEFVAFNSNSSEQKVTQVGPKGIDGKSDITPSFNQTYTVTIPISTIENKLNKTPYGIRLQTGDIGKSQVSIVSLKLID